MSVNYYEPPTPLKPQSHSAAVSQPAKRNWLLRALGAIGTGITFARNTVMNLIFLLLLLLVVSLFIGNTPAPLPAQFVLKLAPQGQLVDQYTYVDPASLLLADENSRPREVLLHELVDTINYAQTDTRVQAIHLDPSGITGEDLSKLAELGQALSAFRASGKKVIATAENYSQGQYYLASFADHIYLHELGTIWLLGLSRQGTYLHSAIEKLGIKVHTFRVGEFKDAIEPFLRDDMSDASRVHNQEWVSMLWRDYTDQVERARGLGPGELTRLINSTHRDLAHYQGDLAAYLAGHKLIDGTANLRQLKNKIHDHLGRTQQDKKFPSVDQERYWFENQLVAIPPSDKVALIIASGDIQEGDQPDGSIGSDTIIEKLRTARKDAAVKAVVLRIDSGGGSAYASDLIYQEIRYLREKGKPVYVSMGRYAASGGYYMAAGADKIFAQPTTLTGSIGVFGLTATFAESAKKLGIYTDGVSTTDIATSENPLLPLPEKTQQILQQSVEFTYRRFINIVADARGRTAEEIDQIAQGRVWTGAKAKELGLVDELGSLRDTINAVAKHAELTDYEVVVIERSRSAKEELLMSLASSHLGALAPDAWLGKFTQLRLMGELQPVTDKVTHLIELGNQRGTLAYCLECDSTQ